MKNLMILFYVLWVTNLSAQQQALRFKVRAGDFYRKNCPVNLDLTTTGLAVNNNTFQLYQIKGKTEIQVPSQFDNGQNLKFVLQGELKKGESQDYVLKPSNDIIGGSKIVLEKNNSGLKLGSNRISILNYQFETAYPPEGVDPIYKKSGFIHPLWSPEGEELTRIQAPDHYHHYGIWGPWTKTKFNGRNVDFWNLAEGEGTVKFSGFLSEWEGPVFGGFKALQQHMDFRAKGEDQVAINEILDVRAWNIDLEKKVWLIDYTTTLNCPLDSGILFEAYRYGGGIGYRATEKWHKDNCTVLTSEGKDRAEADGTSARWCIVEGESSTPSGRAGILFLSHPSNRMHPEPMRVWPMNANGDRGDMFFEFCPIRHNDWKIEKGKDYVLKYRMVVFENVMSAEDAESYWQDFAYPPVTIIVK